MLPLRQLGKGALIFCKRNSSTILSVLALAGVGAVGYFGYKAGENVAYDLAEEYERNGDFDKKTKAKIVVKNMAPVAAAGAVTWACIISSHVIDIRKMKAMAASYAMLAESASVYRRKVIERIGEHKEDEVRGSIAEDEFEKLSDDQRKLAIDTGHGTYLCLDDVTKQTFLASAEWIWSQKSRADRYVVEGEDFISIGEWCLLLGIKEPMAPLCDLGWPASVGVPLINPLPTCTQNSGEPGYHLQYEMEPMTREDADIWNANHYISSAEGYY